MPKRAGAKGITLALVGLVLEPPDEVEESYLKSSKERG